MNYLAGCYSIGNDKYLFIHDTYKPVLYDLKAREISWRISKRLHIPQESILINKDESHIFLIDAHYIKKNKFKWRLVILSRETGETIFEEAWPDDLERWHTGNILLRLVPPNELFFSDENCGYKILLE